LNPNYGTNVDVDSSTQCDAAQYWQIEVVPAAAYVDMVFDIAKGSVSELDPVAIDLQILYNKEMSKD
jgi:hypothetical protein